MKIYTKKLSRTDKKLLDALHTKLKHNDKYYAGYPPNLLFDYSELYPFLQFSINNLGDPFIGHNTRSSHRIECEVMRFFAKITHAPEDYCGYVTNGSTEGNLYGLYLARKHYPNAVAYFSDHSHYSIPKNLDILKIPFKQIPVLKNGEIDYKILEKNLKQNNKKPAIIVANIGTTVLSAIDNLNKIKKALANAKITDYFLHADAAFDGMILPFTKNPPPFCFSDSIDSIAISGHKLIGSPIPCGVVISKKLFVQSLLSNSIEYLKKPDVTISGSRNGITPIFLWYAIKRIGITGFKKLVKDGFAKADYAIKVFNHQNIPSWRNKFALTVIIPALSENLLSKWNVPTGYGFSHITVLPKLTYAMIDELCQDIVAERSGKKIKHMDKLIY